MKEGEKILVDRAREGDVSAFEELVNLHKQKMFSFSLSIAGWDHAVASDILQEALIKAFLYIRNFRGSSSFQTWLWKIVKNELINYKTNPKTTKDVYLEELTGLELNSTETMEFDMVEEEKNNNLRKLISMLSVEHKEVITIVDLQETNYDDAAEMLGLSISALKSRLFRARECLTKLAVKNKKLFL